MTSSILVGEVRTPLLPVAGSACHTAARSCDLWWPSGGVRQNAKVRDGGSEPAAVGTKVQVLAKEDQQNDGEQLDGMNVTLHPAQSNNPQALTSSCCRPMTSMMSANLGTLFAFSMAGMVPV